MRKMARRLALTAFVAINSMVAAGTAQAAQDLNVDSIGGIIIVWCDGCWFWNCNCPASMM